MCLMCICRCGGQTGCEVPVDSTIFGDPCPGTFKYVEVHYACRKGERATQREENSSTAPLNFSLFPIKSRRARPPKAKLFCSPQCNGSYLLRGRGPLKRHLFLSAPSPRMGVAAAAAKLQSDLTTFRV